MNREKIKEVYGEWFDLLNHIIEEDGSIKYTSLERELQYSDIDRLREDKRMLNITYSEGIRFIPYNLLTPKDKIDESIFTADDLQYIDSLAIWTMKNIFDKSSTTTKQSSLVMAEVAYRQALAMWSTKKNSLVDIYKELNK